MGMELITPTWPATSLAPRRPMGHECHHQRARPSSGGENGEWGQGCECPRGHGQVHAGRAGAGDAALQRWWQRQDSKRRCEEASAGSSTRQLGGSGRGSRNLRPAESPTPHRWLHIVSIPADLPMLAQVDMPHARCRHSPGPLGSPCDCLGAWMVDSAPHGACLGTAQSTEAPEVKELGGGGPVEPPTASTWPQRRIPGPTVGPETHLGLQEGGAEQVQSWDP